MRANNVFKIIYHRLFISDNYSTIVKNNLLPSRPSRSVINSRRSSLEHNEKSFALLFSSKLGSSHPSEAIFSHPLSPGECSSALFEIFHWLLIVKTSKGAFNSGTFVIKPSNTRPR